AGNASGLALENKLRHTRIGVVTENARAANGMALAEGDSDHTADRIAVAVNSHYITQPFALGELAIARRADTLAYPDNHLAAGLTALATTSDGAQPVLFTAESGAPLLGG